MTKSLLCAVLLFAFSAYATEMKTTHPSKEDTAIAPSVEDIRCEKLSGHSLSEFKTKLVENCNLNKPYSASMNKLLNDESYFYCCQIRK
jgi:hypothetical protein